MNQGNYINKKAVRQRRTAFVVYKGEGVGDVLEWAGATTFSQNALAQVL